MWKKYFSKYTQHEINNTIFLQKDILWLEYTS